MESAVSRVLSQYPGLVLYFISECKFEMTLLGLANINLDEYYFVVPELSTGREGRLARVYSSKVIEVYLLYLQSALDKCLFHLTSFFKEKILYFQCSYNKLNHSYANYLEDL